MDEGHDGLDSAQLRVLVMVLLGIVAIAGAVDIWLDRPEHWFTPHILVELGLMTVSGGTVGEDGVPPGSLTYQNVTSVTLAPYSAVVLLNMPPD